MKFPRFLPVIVTAALATAASAQTTPATQSSTLTQGLNGRYANNVVAVVEGKVISVSDVVREMTPLLSSLQRDSRDEKDYEQRVQKLQESVIQNLVDRILIIGEFRKDDSRHIPESYVDNAVADDLAQRFDGDRAKFLAYLRAEGKTIREFRRDKEDEIIYAYMRRQRRDAATGVEPHPARTSFAGAEAAAAQPQVHLRIIELTRAESETDAALRARAEQVLGRFRAGEKFAGLARKFNPEKRRDQEGDWGWLTRESFKKEFADIAFGLAAGEVSAPILLPEGGFILFVEERK